MSLAHYIKDINLVAIKIRVSEKELSLLICPPTKTSFSVLVKVLSPEHLVYSYQAKKKVCSVVIVILQPKFLDTYILIIFIAFY